MHYKSTIMQIYYLHVKLMKFSRFETISINKIIHLTINSATYG